jgi:hypothetical protein
MFRSRKLTTFSGDHSKIARAATEPGSLSARRAMAGISAWFMCEILTRIQFS